MTSGTVTRVIETGDSTKEVVYLNVDGTNTYTSRKFNTIQAALLSDNTANGSGSVAVVFSGTMATIHGTDLAKSNVTLTLWGE